MSTHDAGQGNISVLHASDPGANRDEVTKKIVIIMPFGGSSVDAERRYKLEFLRLRYLIEQKTRIQNDNNNTTIRYEVSVAMARVGEIAHHAFDLIASADVVVALLTEKNVNVIYELAIRNLIRPAFLMIVKGEVDDILPIYLRGLPRIEYQLDNDVHSQAVRDEIDKLAGDKGQHFDWESQDIPEDLTQAVDQHDQRLIRAIEGALNQIETSPPRWSEHLRDFAQNQHPGHVFEGWTSYNPTSVIRIKWRKKSLPLEYDPADLDGEPVVYWINHAFSKLYDFTYEAFPEPDGPDALTAGRLIGMVEEFVEPDHMEKFLNDQIVISNRLIFRDKEGQAQTPLQFNNKHPRFANKVFLPCLIAKRTIGETSNPHTTYLIISYIEDFWPVDHPGALAPDGT